MHKRECLMQTLVRPGLSTGHISQVKSTGQCSIDKFQTRDRRTPPPPPPPPPPLRASIQIQGCALALPSGQWYLSSALKRQGNLSFIIKTMCWAPWIELHSFQFFLKYSVKGFWNLANFCFWNPKSCKCLLWNSESWALESGIQHKESGMSLMIGIWNPTNDWNPESNTWNPESTVWNPESKTVLDSLKWYKQSP